MGKFAWAAMTSALSAFAFLVAPPAMTVGGDASPGDAYMFGTNGSCSLAFPVEYGDGSAGFLTAAHCISHNAPLEMEVNGERAELHRVAGRVDSEVTNDEVSRDIALVGVSENTSTTNQVGGGYRIGEVVSAVEVAKRIGTRVCKLGARTAVTCGTLESVNGEMIEVRGVYSASSPIVDHGDSGGAMYLMEGFSTARPLAVVSHGEHLPNSSEMDPNVLYGHMVAPTLERWELSLR